MKPSLARVWAPALVFGAALALLATPLWVGALPLDNDALYADVARTMLRSGDFLNPSIHGVPFLDKPPAFFWLLAAAQQLLGSSVFVLRLPAAISGALIATLVYLAAAAPRTRAVAITASLLLLSMPLFVEYSRRVYMETPVAACVLFALLCFDRGFRNARDGRRAWPSYAAAGALVGAGFMFKSLVGLFPLLAFTLFVAIETRGRALVDAAYLRHGAICLLCAIAIAAPWHVQQLLTKPELFLEFTWKLHVEEQVLSAQPWSTGPVWFYLNILAQREQVLALCVLCGLLWLIFARAGGRAATAPLDRLLGCSLVVTLLILSFSKTKKDLYLLPVTGVAAALGARALGLLIPERHLRWGPVLALVLALRSAPLFDPESEALQGAQVLVPSALAARAVTPPSEPVHVLDLMFMASQYYSERRSVSEWSDPRPMRMTGHIPYIKHGKNMLYTPLHAAIERIVHGRETWLMPAGVFEGLAGQLAAAHVVHRDPFMVVLRAR